MTAVTSVGSMTDDDLYHLVASIEQRSEHPLGKAIVSDYTSHHEVPLTADVGIAMVGTLSPVWGALVHNGGSLLVVLNSALLLSWKYKTNSDEDRNPYVGKLVSNQ